MRSDRSGFSFRKNCQFSFIMNSPSCRPNLGRFFAYFFLYCHLNHLTVQLISTEYIRSGCPNDDIWKCKRLVHWRDLFHQAGFISILCVYNTGSFFFFEKPALCSTQNSNLFINYITMTISQCVEKSYAFDRPKTSERIVWRQLLPIRIWFWRRRKKMKRER